QRRLFGIRSDAAERSAVSFGARGRCVSRRRRTHALLRCGSEAVRRRVADRSPHRDVTTFSNSSSSQMYAPELRHNISILVVTLLSTMDSITNVEAQTADIESCLLTSLKVVYRRIIHFLCECTTTTTDAA